MMAKKKKNFYMYFEKGVVASSKKVETGKQRRNLNFLKIFDNPLLKCLISKSVS